MELIGRLETKIDFIKSTIKEIKDEQKQTAKRCSKEGERIAKVEQKICDHKAHHKEENEMSMKRLSLYVSVMSVGISTGIGIILSTLT